MTLGLALLAATLVLQAAAAFGGGTLRASAWGLAAVWCPHRWLVLPMPTLRGWLAALAVLHGAGIFSFFYLLSEGACTPPSMRRLLSAFLLTGLTLHGPACLTLPDCLCARPPRQARWCAT